MKVVIPQPAWATRYVSGILGWLKRPNAAQVLMDYLLSRRGQTAWNGNEDSASPLPNISGSLTVLIRDAGKVQLYGRQAQTFLEYLGRISRRAARRPPADVGLVSHHYREALQSLPVEDRLEHEDVGQVHAAVEPIIQDDQVARCEFRTHRLDVSGNGSEVQRQRQALCNQASIPVAKREVS